MVVREKFVPSRGDIVWLEFSPKAGHEQSGRRPAYVISPKQYNQKVGLALFYPVTSTIKGYPYEVEITDNLEVKGVILSDQIKSLDWRVRKAELICKLSDDIFDEVNAKLATLISMQSS